MTGMVRPLLEVIALDATDARYAQLGGADRIELVSDMARMGLSPTPATFGSVRAAVDLPIRTMLRQREGYAVGNLDALRRTAKELRAAGADEFVLGFLDGTGAVDLPAVQAILEVIDGCRWTFHRAIDHAADRAAVWPAIGGLPGLDFVLSAGHPAGTGDGLDVLVAEAAAGHQPRHRPQHRPRILAGGGLREPHLDPLRAAGIDAFHTGTAVRRNGAWDAPVDPDRVRRWRDRL